MKVTRKEIAEGFAVLGLDGAPELEALERLRELKKSDQEQRVEVVTATHTGLLKIEVPSAELE